MRERSNLSRVKESQPEEPCGKEEAEHEDEGGSRSNSARVVRLRRAAGNNCHGDTTGLKSVSCYSRQHNDGI